LYYYALILFDTAAASLARHAADAAIMLPSLPLFFVTASRHFFFTTFSLPHYAIHDR